MQELLSKSKFARLAGVNPSTITRICGTILKAAVVGKKIDAAHTDAVAYLANRERVSVAPAATGLDPLYEGAVWACSEAGKYTIAHIQREIRVGYSRASKIRGLMKINGVVPDKGETHEAEPVKIVVTKPRGQAVVKQTKKFEALAEAVDRLENPDDKILEIPDDIEAFADMTLRELTDRFGTDAAFVDWLSATQKIEAINEKRLKNAQTKGTLISRELVKVGVIDTFNSAHLRLLKDGAKSIAAGAVSKHSSGAELSEIEAYVSDILGSFIKPVKNKIARVLKNA